MFSSSTGPDAFEEDTGIWSSHQPPGYENCVSQVPLSWRTPSLRFCFFVSSFPRESQLCRRHQTAAGEAVSVLSKPGRIWGYRQPRCESCCSLRRHQCLAHSRCLPGTTKEAGGWDVASLLRDRWQPRLSHVWKESRCHGPITGLKCRFLPDSPTPQPL